VGLLSVAVLTDRARVHRVVAAGPRVEGRTSMADTSLGWFPCRLVLGEAREVEGEGRRRIVEVGELVSFHEDVRTSDTLEVESAVHGRGRWRVSGRVQAAPTRRPVRAVVVPVERLAEPSPPDSVIP
jgi:hypothetical protein